MARYVRGEIARISGEFRVAGVLTTPTTTTVVVTKPDGTTVAPEPTVVTDSAGLVHADVTTDLSGLWHWRMVGTGAAAGVFEGSFSVRESPLDDLLTPAQFRAAKRTNVDDDTLQIYIDAATSAIVSRFGRIAPIVERRRGGGRHIWLSRQASTITTVIEGYADPIGLGSTVLDATDWTLLADATAIERLNTGTHASDRWGEWIDVAYLPLDTSADRQRVVIALVKLDLDHNPGKTAEQIADYSTSYASNSVMNYTIEREQILDSLGTVAFA